MKDKKYTRETNVIELFDDLHKNQDYFTLDTSWLLEMYSSCSEETQKKIDTKCPMLVSYITKGSF